MSRVRPALTFNVTGQSLTYRVLKGRPTSGTFAVYRDTVDDTQTPEFSGSVTTDTVNTTVSQASGRSQTDPKILYVSSTAGIVTGRKYLLSENSRKEWLEPLEIGTGYIRVRNPISNDYTTAGTFVSTYISAAVDSTWIANANNITWYSAMWWSTAHYGVQIGETVDPFPGYRVLYTLTVSGVTYTEYDFFDIVRAPVQHHVDMEDVNARAPGLVATLPAEYQSEDGQPLVESAWRAVRAHLVAVGIDPQAMRDNEALDELVTLRALRILAEGGWSPAKMDKVAYIQLTTGNYTNFFETHVGAVMKARTAAGAGGAATYATPLPFFRK